MKDSFRDSVAIELLEWSRQFQEEAKIGDTEIDVLLLFYDEKKKIRRTKVPKFHLYASVCDGKLEDSWPGLMLKVNTALLTLERVNLIQPATPSNIGADTARYVGGASALFELTAKGLERLQRLRPTLAVQFRGWVAAAPPWLVIAGSIAGGLSAIWGFTRLLIAAGVIG